MRRIMIIIAYEGTAYAGFQIQPTAPTIEGILNAMLTQCLHEDIRIIGASRTDAGVHKGHFRVQLPGKPYMAVQIRKV